MCMVMLNIKLFFCCCLKYVLCEGNYAAETFSIEAWFFSCESTELHLLTVILKLFCVCFGVVLVFFINIIQRRVYGRLTLALN